MCIRDSSSISWIAMEENEKALRRLNNKQTNAVVAPVRGLYIQLIHP